MGNNGVAIDANRDIEIAIAMLATSMIAAAMRGFASDRPAPTSPTKEKKRADHPRLTTVPAFQCTPARALRWPKEKRAGSGGGDGEPARY